MRHDYLRDGIVEQDQAAGLCLGAVLGRSAERPFTASKPVVARCELQPAVAVKAT